jgi:hypothetical protein
MVFSSDIRCTALAGEATVRVMLRAMFKKAIVVSFKVGLLSQYSYGRNWRLSGSRVERCYAEGSSGDFPGCDHQLMLRAI